MHSWSGGTFPTCVKAAYMERWNLPDMCKIAAFVERWNFPDMCKIAAFVERWNRDTVVNRW